MAANRSVVVTGASTGIGWGTAKVLVARGFQVFGSVRKQSDADRLANELGPATKTGVVRIKICQGAWLLDPDGTKKTRATYSVYTDTGGVIPSLIANHFSERAIEKVFAAVRKQVKEPKYDATE